MTAAPPARFDPKWACYWTVVFSANLPMPVLFAAQTVAESSQLGVLAGFAVVYWVGLVLCGFRFRVGRSLVVGGAILIPLQLFPIPQAVLTLIADLTWEWAGGRQIISVPVAYENGASVTENSLGAFWIVLFAAWGMSLLAIFFGAGARNLAGDHPLWWGKPAGADPDAEGT